MSLDKSKFGFLHQLFISIQSYWFIYLNCFNIINVVNFVGKKILKFNWIVNLYHATWHFFLYDKHNLNLDSVWLEPGPWTKLKKQWLVVVKFQHKYQILSFGLVVKFQCCKSFCPTLVQITEKRPVLICLWSWFIGPALRELI